MQFKQVLIAALVSAVASAQDPNSVAAFASAAGAYIQSLVADPSFQSQVAGLATADPSVIAQLQSLQTQSINPAQLTAPPAFITALPSPYNTLFSSIFQHEYDLASSYGLVGGGSAATVSATGSSASSVLASASAAASSQTSALSSGISSAVASAASSASAASASASSSVSKGAAPTALPIMGVAVGAIGALAALL